MAVSGTDARFTHTPPKTNACYWAMKIEGNRVRDQHTTAMLRAAGWTVLRFWSHEQPLAVANRIAEVIQMKKEIVSPVVKRSMLCQ
jgi:DNA mismatch endonuclease (patch repair protein)